MANWTLVLPNNTTLGLTENNDLAVVGISGAGMPPIENIYTSYGLGDGALYQRASVQPRLVTVLIDAVGTSWVGLHNLRAKLIEAVNPHEATPITLKYSAGGSKPDLYLDCYYDSGLEGGVTEGFMEKGMALRLLATDPYWYEDTETTGDLAHIQTVTDVSGVVWREADGTINNMDEGVGAAGARSVTAITELDDAIQVYGGFAQVGSTPLAVLSGGEWDGADWADLAAPWATLADYVSGGTFTTQATQGPGYIYVSGLYEGSGATVYGVWSYDGTTWSWIETADYAYAIAVAPDGVLYAYFDATLYYYDTGTSAWVSVGAGTGLVYALAFAGDGTIYAGGTLTVIGGVAVSKVAKYTGGSWVALGDGLDDTVQALAIGPEGTVYAGGDFDNSGSVPMAKVAKWNGVSWGALGDGFDGLVWGLHINDDGELIAAGIFDSTGSKSLPSQVATWHDNMWLDMGSGYASDAMTGGVYVAYEGTDGLYLGGQFYGTWTAAGTTSVTNAGTARAYPVITLAGPGALYYIINWTTDQRLYFDLTLLEGETLTIDLRPGIKTITSNFRGNCLPFLVSGNLIDWYLAPGTNDIGVWIDDATADADISFEPRYWSADGAVPTP